MVFWLQINICLSNGSLATDVTRLSHKKNERNLALSIRHHQQPVNHNGFVIVKYKIVHSGEKRAVSPRGDAAVTSPYRLRLLVKSLLIVFVCFVTSPVTLESPLKNKREPVWPVVQEVLANYSCCFFFALIYHYEVSIDCTVWWLRTTWNAWTCLTTLTAP